MEDPLSEKVLAEIFCPNPKNTNLINKREGTSIEFKQSYNHGSMTMYFKTIASFANCFGGYILFGIGDEPRSFWGLEEKSLKQFESLKVEQFTQSLLEYFSPEIKWDHCTYVVQNKSFGVLYAYPLDQKPCICKKTYTDKKNPRFSLREGDIYYRYRGRSERIRYAELARIIDETRKEEELRWLNFLKRASRIGVSNAALLDLNSGKLSGNGGTIVVDTELLKKISFIKEGQFVEKNGKPTLRLVGDINEISPGKVVVRETSKKVVRNIEPCDIVHAFLKGEDIESPIEYVKRVCSATSAQYPVYYFVRKAHKKVSEILKIIQKITCRNVAKNWLIERFNGKTIQQEKFSTSPSSASKQKKWFRDQWISESIPDKIENFNYCLQAILYLSDSEIEKNRVYICSVLLRIYDNCFENANPSLASNIRKAICRVDEALNLDNVK